MSRTLVLCLAVSTAVLGCVDDSVDTMPIAAGTGGTGGSTAPSGPFFHEDIEPLVQTHCQSCHVDGGIAPFALVTYEDAAAVAGLIAAQTAERTMPPWGAYDSDACQPTHAWRDDLRLSDEQIALFQAWSDAGAPEGDPANAPPPIESSAGNLPGLELEVLPDEPFETSGDEDQFPCLVLDPGLTEDVFLDGWHFRAGEPSVVHHILLFTVPASVDQPADYDCAPVLGAGAELIGGFVPGMPPTELEPGIGLPIKGGSKLAMQMHYHPGGTTKSDATRVQLRFADATPTRFMRLSLVGNDSAPSDTVPGDGLQPGPNDPGGVAFLVPADVAGHTEEMVVTMPGDAPNARLYGAGAHMHWLGTNMRVMLEHPNGDSECLIETPKYDFAWQRFYEYDAPVDELPQIGPGDKLRLLCTYDNTKDNPYVIELLESLGMSVPQDATLGENTYDEMCIFPLPQVIEPPATYAMCEESCDKVEESCGLAGKCAELEVDCVTTKLQACTFQCTLDATCADITAGLSGTANVYTACLQGC